MAGPKKKRSKFIAFENESIYIKKICENLRTKGLRKSFSGKGAQNILNAYSFNKEKKTS